MIVVDINDIRTIDGTNNQIDGEGNSLGETRDNGYQGAPLVRLFEPAYDDGINSPRGGGAGNTESTLPNPRDISNAISPQGDRLGNPLNASDWLWQWGQFLDHDLGLSEGTNILTLESEEEQNAAKFDIPLSETDILYGENFTAIPVSRVPAVEETGVEGNPREVENDITAYIDGSNAYGSSYIRGAAKRTDLGNSFFRQFGEGEIVIDPTTGQQVLAIGIDADDPLEVVGIDFELLGIDIDLDGIGIGDGNSEEAGEGEGTAQIPLPPPGQSPYDGKLLVANDTYGTDGVLFDGINGDPNNTSGEILPPYNRNDSPNADPDPDSGEEGRVPNDQEFVSGDVRINEQSGLIAIHTLLVREHNRIAGAVAFHLDAATDPALNAAYAQYRDVYVPSLNLPEAPSETQIRGEFIFEASRTLVGAANQVISYEEFLPILVGNENAADLETIAPEILSPGIAAEFSGAAYRLGHTLLSDELRTVNSEGYGSISLREAFFTPQAISANGVDEVLIGLNYQESNDADPFVIDGVRNSLFGPPGSGGLDLVAINIQRGRDLGLPSYTEVYNQLNPEAPITSFADLVPIFGADLVPLFESAYDNVAQIDLWLGGIAELPAEPGILLGPTLSAIVGDQFARLRDYDRFFYEVQLADPDSFLSVVANAIDLDIGDIRLADIIRNNVTTPELVPTDAFKVPFEQEIIGTENDDRNGNSLVGTGANELIDGQAGNDRITGGGGNDYLFGGAGDDSILGEAGFDVIVAGEGNDILVGQAGDNFNGGVGNDTYRIVIDGASPTQIADAGGSNDVLELSVPGGDPREIALRDPQPGLTGIKKSGQDLLIDLNQDGILTTTSDLTIADYFNSEGLAGSGAIEQVGNLSTTDIVTYANTDIVSEGATVYRFYNPTADVYFYTSSEKERDAVIENLDDVYVDQGTAYVAAPADEDSDSLTGAKPVYRFLNVDAGVHLYTIQDKERDFVLENLPNFSYEGVAYYGYETQAPDTTPVYRFLNTATGTHFYTTSATERDEFTEGFPNYELEGDSGITFYVPSEIV